MTMIRRQATRTILTPTRSSHPLYIRPNVDKSKKLTHLDLSTLGLKPLLLRQEYDHISTLIKREPRKIQGSVIDSGQPGMVKTAYLYLRITQSMIEGCPFRYQAYDGTVYHVNEDGVRVIWTWSSTGEIVAFVDGDKEDSEPDDILIRERVQIIMASPPRDASERWIKQMRHVNTCN